MYLLLYVYSWLFPKVFANKLTSLETIYYSIKFMLIIRGGKSLVSDAAFPEALFLEASTASSYNKIGRISLVTLYKSISWVSELSECFRLKSFVNW